MRQLGLNDQLLAEACTREARSRGVPLRMSRERVAKILMNCKKNPERSAARIISYSELKAFAAALSVSAEWLVGQHDNQDPVHWNVLAEPERVGHLLHLLAEYEERSGELLAWAESLTCSLMTPELMHAYHKARFSELRLPGLKGGREDAIAFSDEIGNTRRARLLMPEAVRGYRHRQIIFYSDLNAVAAGEGEYGRTDPALRRESLKYLADIIGDRKLGIDLFVVHDDAAPDLRRALHDYESLSVSGPYFTIWGYHSGNVAWSEHRSYIEPHRQILDELQSRAMTYRPKEVTELLVDMSCKVKAI
jgi:hypothetical protein